MHVAQAADAVGFADFFPDGAVDRQGLFVAFARLRQFRQPDMHVAQAKACVGVEFLVFIMGGYNIFELCNSLSMQIAVCGEQGCKEICPTLAPIRDLTSGYPFLYCAGQGAQRSKIPLSQTLIMPSPALITHGICAFFRVGNQQMIDLFNIGLGNERPHSLRMFLKPSLPTLISVISRFGASEFFLPGLQSL